MSARIRIGIMILGLTLVLSTCTKDIYAPSTCFPKNILPIFVSNCAMSGCHNSKDKEGGYDLSNYEGIMKGVVPHHPLLSEVYKEIKGKNPSMPEDPYPKLSAADVNLIKLWINAGAYSSRYCSGCDSSDYTYSHGVSPILNSWCVNCHNPGNKSGNVDLSSYPGVSAVAVDKRLSGSINHRSGFSPMPQSGYMMDQCNIRIIEKWLEAGHPEN
ncbi:MAG: hypothetical protein JNL60_05270 [Bacteroidia bacterium]|nr:hypothetical protein [Bacteroidia bacterium]